VTVSETSEIVSQYVQTAGSQPLLSVTNRYQPLPNVTKRYQPLPTVTKRYQQLPTVTNRYQTLLGISGRKKEERQKHKMASTMAAVFAAYGIRGMWSGHQSPTLCQILVEIISDQGNVAGMSYLEIVAMSSQVLRQRWDREKANIRKKACVRRKSSGETNERRSGGVWRRRRLVKVMPKNGVNNIRRAEKGILPRRRIVESDEEISSQEDHCDNVCLDPDSSTSTEQVEMAMDRASIPDSIRAARDRSVRQQHSGASCGREDQMSDNVVEGLDGEVEGGCQLGLALVGRDGCEEEPFQLFQEILRPRWGMMGNRWNLDYMRETEREVDHADHTRLRTLLPERLVWHEGDLYGTADGYICGRIVTVPGNGDCYYRAVSEALKYCGIAVPRAWDSDPTGKFKRWLIKEVSGRLDWVVPYQFGLTVAVMAVNAIKALLRRAKDYEAQGSEVDSNGTVVHVTTVQTATVSRELVKELLGGGRKKKDVSGDGGVLRHGRVRGEFADKYGSYRRVYG
jgi:hypothetical protein